MDANSSLYLLVGGLTAASTCVWAGARHLAEPGVLTAALQQVPSSRRPFLSAGTPAMARGWGAVELTSGLAVLGTLLLGSFSRTQQLVVLGWLTLLYLGFTLWLIRQRRVPGSLCGCGARPEPADGPAVLRTGSLGLAAAVPTAFLVAGQELGTPARGWLALPMALTLALIIWTLPTCVRPLGAEDR